MTRHSDPDIQYYGDTALLVKFSSNSYSDLVIERLHALSGELQKNPNWEEVVTGYNELMVCFNPLTLDQQKATALLRKALQASIKPNIKGNAIDVPVVYGGAFGPDIANIVRSSNLSETEIIKQHSDPIYKAVSYTHLTLPTTPYV